MGGNGEAFLVIFFVFIGWNRGNLLFGWNGSVSAGEGVAVWQWMGGVSAGREWMSAVEWGETGEIFGIFFLFLSGGMGGKLLFQWNGEIYCSCLGYYHVKPSLFCILKLYDVSIAEWKAKNMSFLP